ncbi:beta-glucanase (GH16 family) [Paenibacillus phyllosphaerae]|uniref:Beta-glucanase (GH16 family) n=1 Tax=Paenibacillus phyllosphaerae TaxID=274593 RepID=A0A7W5AUM8_9BACL|nr:carbohydrate binding domain-containing protein [Paenibacillus phyllosphaerae]MBB3108849.1 beta-glucanase (GH16 family) [Paenibacillus phyllosphaerae]
MMSRKWISVTLISGLFLSALSPTAYGKELEQPKAVAGFADLSGHWAQPAAEELEAWGLMKGFADGSFQPKRLISRAEFVTVLDRAFGFKGKAANQFEDVREGSWYYDSVRSASGSGIVNGIDDEHFAPEADITREEAAVMLDRAFRLSKGDKSEAVLQTYSDAGAIGGYAKKALTYLVGSGAMKGANGMLLPKKPITRAEAAVLLTGMIADIVTAPSVYEAGQIEGNVIVRSEGVTVKNTVIDGSLLLTEGIGEGEITLNSVMVRGNTIIKGGGSHSIEFHHSQLDRVVIDKSGDPVRVAFLDGTKANDVTVMQAAQIELSKDSVIGKLAIGDQAERSQLTSEGTIDHLTIEANGVTVNGKSVLAGLTSSMRPEENEAGQPVVTTTPNPGSPSSELPVPPTTIPDKDWKLIWNDEFDAAAVDASKWTVVDTDVVYNNELEYYSPNNASIVKDGSRSVLQLEAKKEAYRGSNYTSAKLITQGKGDWTYGKVVVRAKLPVDQGMWPAIWMLPTDEAHYGGWPAAGEIDIMELIGGEKNKSRVYGTLHYDSVQPDGSHGSDQGSYDLQSGQSFADSYHDFQVEWLPGVIRFYVDGQLYHEVSDWKTKGPGQPEYYTYPAPFDRPFYLILNLAVGGDWPGSPSEAFVSDEMKVDFVRVYSYENLSSWPDVTGNPPEPPAQREPQADGNQLYNDDFTGDVDAGGVPQDWQYLLNANGAGSVSVINDEVKGKAAKVSITQPGEQLYSVQLTQLPMYIQKGKKYQVTFDAKADASRSIMSKVNQYQKSWKNYSGERYFTLTTDWQPYAYTFDMRESTDNNARFEFNLGLDAETVYIANVKLTEIGDAEPLPDELVVRAALPDGNLVYNGTFDQGQDRLAFWTSTITPEAKAQIGVNNFLKFPIMERQLVVGSEDGGTDANAIAVSQPELPLEPNTTYGLYFDARSDRPRSMEIGLERTDGGSVQFPKGTSVQLGTEPQTYAKDIVIGEGAAAVESELRLLFGGSAGTVYMDNVRLVKRGQPIHVNGYAHASATQAWEMQGLQLEDSGEGGKNVGYMDEGDLLQYKVSVERNADYVLSARVASGEEDSPIRVSVRDEEGTTIAASAYMLGNTGGWQTYRTVYFDPVRLESGHSYYIDMEGYDYNTLWVDMAESLVRNGTFDTDMNEWSLITSSGASAEATEAGELSVRLPGTGTQWWDEQLQQYDLLIKQGRTYRLEFDASSSVPRSMQAVVSKSSGDYAKYLNEEAALTEDSAHYSYTFTMEHDSDMASVIAFGFGQPASAEGSHSVTLDNVRLYEVNRAADNGGQPVHINLLHNGDFAQGTDGWFSYSAGDPSQLAIAAEGGKLRASIGTVGDNAWDRQVINEGFAIEEGSRYTITFKAQASTARKMGIGIGWVDVAANYEWHGYFGQQIDLTTEEQTFTFTFDAAADGYSNSRISFDMGNILGGNAGQTDITISEVSLVNIGPAS